MKTQLVTFFLSLLTGMGLYAKEIMVSPGTFATEYTAAEDGDILLLEDGFYGNELQFPSGKTVTLKAEEDASPVFIGTVYGSASIHGGGLIFDGVDIKRDADYVIYAELGDSKLIAFRNLTISNVNRCLIRALVASGEGPKTIEKIEFENCIIKDCGNNTWNLIYTQHGVRNIIVRNSTLYNYINGESFFCVYASNPDNVLDFLFENNTVYKWGKDSNRAFAKIESSYHENSTYTFRNNIVTEPGVENQSPKMVHANAGIVVAQNNLIVNYGGYNGGTQTINDLTLEELGLESIGFPDPENGDFSIVSTSPLVTAGVDGTCLGDPRWIKSLTNPVSLSTGALPEEGGEATPAAGVYESGEWITVRAEYNYGYRFKEWQQNGQTVSSDNPYMFRINEDTEMIAVFDPVETYALTVNIEGDGAPWANVQLNPEPVNGAYEVNEIVTVTVIPNDVTVFMYWDDQTTELSRQVLIDSDKSLTATFDWVPFIVGWTFDPAEPRTARPGDYYSRTDNVGIMKFFEGDGVTTTNWGSSTKTFGNRTYAAARRYTGATDMDNPRYFQAEFSVQDFEQITYKNIRVSSYIGADNGCVHTIQKMQFATNQAGPYEDLATIDLTPYYDSEWVEFSAVLPELSEAEKERIFIRWIGDTESELLGTPSSSDTEGFFLANVIVYAEMEVGEDNEPPVLLSSIPAEGTTTASANGSVILTFNERVTAGLNDGKVEFNGEVLEPVFGNRTVSYSYKNLSYGTPYIFTVPAGAIIDMSGNEYEGTAITFSTMERPQPIARLYDAVVDINGNGDYTSVQEAINNMPDNRTTPWLIFIKNGRYDELIRIPSSKPFIHLIGQDKEEVILTFKIHCGESEEDYSMAYWGVTGSCTAVMIEATDFYAENISFENAWGVETQSGPQALTVRTYNDRATFYNCKLRSFQDTWQTSTNGLNDRAYVTGCFIEGAVDYIYAAGNAYIENTVLYNTRSGYIVAPSQGEGTRWGYVFNNCVIDGKEDVANTSLGRPWRDGAIAVFLNTTMLLKPHAEGWSLWNSIPKIFAEYNSTDENGNPVDLSSRRSCYQADTRNECITSVLTHEEAAVYTYENVVQDLDNWNPRAYFEAVSKPADLSFSENGELSWTESEYAICYVIYKNNEVTGFSIIPSYMDESAAKGDVYSVRPVNEYGSQGERSNEITFSGRTALQDTEAGEDKPWIERDGENLHICNVKPGVSVHVFTVDGRFVTGLKANSNRVLLPAGLSKGIYVIKVDEYSVKVII